MAWHVEEKKATTNYYYYYYYQALCLYSYACIIESSSMSEPSWQKEDRKYRKLIRCKKKVKPSQDIVACN